MNNTSIETFKKSMNAMKKTLSSLIKEEKRLLKSRRALYEKWKQDLINTGITNIEDYTFKAENIDKRLFELNNLRVKYQDLLNNFTYAFISTYQISGNHLAKRFGFKTREEYLDAKNNGHRVPLDHAIIGILTADYAIDEFQFEDKDVKVSQEIQTNNISQLERIAAEAARQK